MEIPSLINVPTFKVPEIKSIPEYAFNSIKSSIKRFEKSLNKNQEAAIRVGSATGIIAAANLTLLDAGLIEIRGYNSNSEVVSVICHYTQLSIELVAMSTVEEQPRKIGF